MFSTSFFKHMESCLMTTTFVTDCWSCVAAAADKPAASSCFVMEGERAAERIGVSDTQLLTSYNQSKSNNLMSWGTQGNL